MKKTKTKSKKIQGIARVVAWDSACIGMCGMETPYVDMEINGKVYRWWSENAEHSGLYGTGTLQMADITAFIRKSNGRLFNVKISNIRNGERKLEAWAILTSKDGTKKVIWEKAVA